MLCCLMKRGDWNIPEYELESLVKCFLPDIQEFYATDEGKEYFKEYQAKEKLEIKEEPLKRL